MKRFLFLLLSVAVAIPLFAQEQEEHVVRRGRYKAAVVQEVVKEKKPVNWYNVFSLSGQYGSCGTAEVKGTTAAHIALSNCKREFGAANFSLGYERLARFGGFYIGPALRVRYGTSDFWSGDISLAMKLRIGKGKVSPYLGASAGCSYMSLTLKGASYYEFTHEYRTGTCQVYSEVYGGRLSDDVLKESGFAPQYTLNAGLLFDVGKHSSLAIGYCASPFPYINAYATPDAATIVDSPQNETCKIHLQNDGLQMKLRQGVEITFMF